MIHSKRTGLAFVLAPIFYLLSSFHLGATINVISDWRLGESDPSAIAGNTALTSIDYVGSHTLTFQGTAIYTSDVGFPAQLRVGSLLSVKFTNSAFATNSVVSTAVDNFGIEAWVKPVSTADGVVFYNGDTGLNGWGITIGNGHYNGLYGGVQVIAGPAIDVQVWTHVALVRSNSVNYLFVHAAAGTPDFSTPHAPAGYFGLACPPQAPGTGQSFTGAIDEVRVFTFAPGQFTPNDLLANLPVEQVTPLPATTIRATSATLGAGFIPSGLDTSVWLEWGLSTGYGNSSSPQFASAALTSVQISTSATNLLPGHAYHYRAVASNSVSILRSWDRTFVTPVINVTSTNQTAYFHVPFTNAASLTATPLKLSAADSPNGMVLKADGTVALWGDNSYGQVDFAKTLSNIVDVAAGDYHFLALRRDGTVVAWGNNNVGQNNIPPGLDNVVAVAAGGGRSMALRRDGTVANWGSALSLPTPLTNIVQLSASYTTTFQGAIALTADGQVVYNGSLPPGVTNILSVSAGDGQAMALRADGSLFVWGVNSYGQTNIQPGLANVTAVSASGGGCMALSKDGTINAWGSDDSSKNSVPPSATNIVAIAASGASNFAMRDDGTVLYLGNYIPIARDVPTDTTNITGVINATGVNPNVPGVYPITYTSTNFLGSVSLAAGPSLSLILPTLTITPASPGNVTLSWPPEASTYSLQQNSSLSLNGWVAAPSGMTNPATVPKTNPQSYYRLTHP